VHHTGAIDVTGSPASISRNLGATSTKHKGNRDAVGDGCSVKKFVKGSTVARNLTRSTLRFASGTC